MSHIPPLPAARVCPASVALVPTAYWISSAPSNKVKPGECYPDAWAHNQTVDYFCSRYEWDKDCEPFTTSTVQRFAAGFRQCLQKVRRRPPGPRAA